jgi:hypothetical protein
MAMASAPTVMRHLWQTLTAVTCLYIQSQTACRAAQCCRSQLAGHARKTHGFVSVYSSPLRHASMPVMQCTRGNSASGCNSKTSPGLPSLLAPWCQFQESATAQRYSCSCMPGGVARPALFRRGHDAKPPDAGTLACRPACQLTQGMHTRAELNQLRLPVQLRLQPLADCCGLCCS